MIFQKRGKDFFSSLKRGQGLFDAKRGLGTHPVSFVPYIIVPALEDAYDTKNITAHDLEAEMAKFCVV